MAWKICIADEAKKVGLINEEVFSIVIITVMLVTLITPILLNYSFKRNNKNAPSLFSQMQALKEMGVNTQKDIPDILINDTADDNYNEVMYNDENINC